MRPSGAEGSKYSFPVRQVIAGIHNKPLAHRRGVFYICEAISHREVRPSSAAGSRYSFPVRQVIAGIHTPLPKGEGDFLCILLIYAYPSLTKKCAPPATIIAGTLFLRRLVISGIHTPLQKRGFFYMRIPISRREVRRTNAEGSRYTIPVREISIYDLNLIFFVGDNAVFLHF